MLSPRTALPLALAASTLGWGAPCDVPEVLLDQAETAIIEGRLDEAEVLTEKTGVSFRCGTVATPRVLGRLWLAEGALFTLQMDAEGDDAFAAAARVAPGFWNDAYGARLRDAYDRVSAIPAPPAIIDLDPPVSTYVGLLDGTVTTFPVEAPSGLHLVQVGPSADRAVFSIMMYLPAGNDVVLRTGIDESVQLEPIETLAVTDPGPRTRGDRKRRPLGLILASGGAAILASVSAGLALNEKRIMENTSDLDTLYAAQQRQLGWAISSYTLMGLTGAGVVVYVAL